MSARRFTYLLAVLASGLGLAGQERAPAVDAEVVRLESGSNGMTLAEFLALSQLHTGRDPRGVPPQNSLRVSWVGQVRLKRGELVRFFDAFLYRAGVILQQPRVKGRWQLSQHSGYGRIAPIAAVHYVRAEDLSADDAGATQIVLTSVPVPQPLVGTIRKHLETHAPRGVQVAAIPTLGVVLLQGPGVAVHRALEMGRERQGLLSPFRRLAVGPAMGFGEVYGAMTPILRRILNAALGEAGAAMLSETLGRTSKHKSSGAWLAALSETVEGRMAIVLGSPRQPRMAKTWALALQFKADPKQRWQTSVFSEFCEMLNTHRGAFGIARAYKLNLGEGDVFEFEFPGRRTVVIGIVDGQGFVSNSGVFLMKLLRNPGGHRERGGRPGPLDLDRWLRSAFGR